MRGLLVIIGIVLLLLALTIAPVSNNIATQSTCVSAPDPLHTVFYNGVVYRRIRVDVAIFRGEIATHLEPTVPSEIFVDNKFREGYIPWYDGLLDDKYVTWRPISGVTNLLFIDTTADHDKIYPGFSYFDVYLRPDVNNEYTIPAFIQIFCQQNFPVGKRTIYPDKDGNFFPPASFKVSDIVNWQPGNTGVLDKPPADKEYYIITYEAENSPSWNISTGALWPTAELIVGKNGKMKKYKVHYIAGSVIQAIALIDMDPNSPDSHIAYRYTFPTEDFTPLEGTPPPVSTTSRQNLQLETFYYPNVQAWGWWNPECKPAIYLYPEEKTTVHVTIKPEGYLTYTDPHYPVNGWDVIAHPDGVIEFQGERYPYLYYESKIRDSAIQKPSAGYVVAYAMLPALYNEVLPKLGLTEKEVKDFKEYWEKTLPEAPYYFVGIMENEAINKIEPLTISPKEDTIIRVRLYFEALEEMKSVTAPTFPKIERKGFVVSEWGGLVKVDKDHPFTCSQ